MSPKRVVGRRAVGGSTTTTPSSSTRDQMDYSGSANVVGLRDGRRQAKPNEYVVTIYKTASRWHDMIPYYWSITTGEPIVNRNRPISKMTGTPVLENEVGSGWTGTKFGARYEAHQRLRKLLTKSSSPEDQVKRMVVDRWVMRREPVDDS